MGCLDVRGMVPRALAVWAVIWMIGGGSGCRQQSSDGDAPSAPKAKPTTMRVVVVDDAPFAAELERQWKARIENELQLQQMTVAEVETARQLHADIVFYPSVCLGTLVEHKLIAAPSAEVLNDAQYASREIFELPRRVEGRWGEDTYAFPFGSPHLVLMYRADLFEQLKVQPPQTWEEYAALLPRLTRTELGESAPAEDQPWSPTIEPLADRWAAKILLARVAAYASDPSQYSALFDYVTMEPLIATPPFVRALEELTAAAQATTLDPTQHTPESARRALMAGQAAMALTWPSRATSDDRPLPLAAGIQVAFAQLPGANTVYNFGERSWSRRGEEQGTSLHVPLIAIAGRLASVGTNARRPREAAGILALLSGREWSPRLCPRSPSTTLFRRSHLKYAELWTDEELPQEVSVQYGEVAAASQSQPSCLAMLRIPGWQRYLAALDQAVLDARAGTQTPADALAATVKSWQAITEELGLEAQRKAYTRSLGLEP